MLGAEVNNTNNRQTGMNLSPPANWYPDPQNTKQFRYWDGTCWTQHCQPASNGSLVELGEDSPHPIKLDRGRELLPPRVPAHEFTNRDTKQIEVRQIMKFAISILLLFILVAAGSSLFVSSNDSSTQAGATTFCDNARQTVKLIKEIPPTSTVGTVNQMRDGYLLLSKQFRVLYKSAYKTSTSAQLEPERKAFSLVAADANTASQSTKAAELSLLSSQGQAASASIMTQAANALTNWKTQTSYSLAPAQQYLSYSCKISSPFKSPA